MEWPSFAWPWRWSQLRSCIWLGILSFREWLWTRSMASTLPFPVHGAYRAQLHNFMLLIIFTCLSSRRARSPGSTQQYKRTSAEAQELKWDVHCTSVWLLQTVATRVWNVSGGITDSRMPSPARFTAFPWFQVMLPKSCHKCIRSPWLSKREGWVLNRGAMASFVVSSL